MKSSSIPYVWKKEDIQKQTKVSDLILFPG